MKFYRFSLIILVSVILAGPSFVLAQGSVPDARVTDTPIPADTGGVSATAAPVAAPAATSIVTPRPVLTTAVPIPTPRPTPPISPQLSPQPESLAGDQPDPLPENWFYKYALTLLGMGGVALLSYGVFKFNKSKQNKNNKDSDGKCGSIRELLEQKKKELEVMIKNWPEEKLKSVTQEKISGELKKDEDIKKVIETAESLKAKHDQLKKTIETLQKKYDLCVLELPSMASQLRLSYLMGAENIQDKELENIGVKIEGRTPEGDRMLKISEKELAKYIELIKTKLANGFWNEIIGANEIIFIFKFKDGSIKEYKLSPDNEQEIDKLCAEFNNELSDKTANVYKYISENKFYHDFMTKHYSDMINRY